MWNDFVERERPHNIRVLFARNPPDAFDNCAHFPTMNPSLECPFPGWCVEIVSYLAQFLRLNVKPVVFDNEIGQLDWGFHENGSWTGVLGQIHNGTADTACLFYQRTQLRADYFDFSYPITNVKPTYVVRSRPEDLSSVIWNAFSPYAPSTWFSMGMMLIVQALFCIWVTKMEILMGKRAEFHPYQVIWKIIRLQLYQPDSFDFKTAAGNFAVLVFTIMQCRLLLDMYQTLLLSALLQPTPENPFRDAKEMIRLIGSQRYKLITNYIGNWYFEELHNSNVSHYRSLRIAISNNPIHVENSVAKALDKVTQGGYIYPIQEDSIAMQLARQRCGLAFVSEGLPEVSAHLVFSKGSPFYPLFEHAIAMNLDFVRRTFDKYFTHGFKLEDSAPSAGCHGLFKTTMFAQRGAAAGRWDVGENGIELKPLDLLSMFGVIFVALFGLGISLLVFSAELYYNYKKRMLLLRLKTRRALAQQAHLTAATQVFIDPEVQLEMEQRLQRPTLGELHACFGEVYI